MATRFYFTEASATPTPTPAAKWNTSNFGYTTVGLSITKTTTAFTTVTANGVPGSIDSCLLRQYISPPLAAQTISGTFYSIINSTSASATNSIYATAVTRVFNAAGNSLRGTLNSNEYYFYFNTLVRSDGFSDGTGQAITSVDCQDGDVIVFEFGVGNDNASTRNCSIVMGNDSDLGDHTVSNSSSSLNGWVEFSANLSFYTPPSGEVVNTNQLMMMGVGT